MGSPFLFYFSRVYLLRKPELFVWVLHASFLVISLYCVLTCSSVPCFLLYSIQLQRLADSSEFLFEGSSFLCWSGCPERLVPCVGRGQSWKCRPSYTWGHLGGSPLIFRCPYHKCTRWNLGEPTHVTTTQSRQRTLSVFWKFLLTLLSPHSPEVITILISITRDSFCL